MDFIVTYFFLFKLITTLFLSFTFLYNRKTSFIFQIHLPYVQFPSPTKLRDYRLLKDNPTRDQYCTGEESGPFLAISRPLSGLSNQFHYLHNVLVLADGFQGTIIFPRYTSTRKPMKVNATEYEWQPTTMDKLYDIESTSRKLRKLGMNVCIESRKLTCFTTTLFRADHFFDYTTVMRRCMAKVGCFAKHINEVIERHYPGNTCLRMPNIWGGVPIPHSAKEDFRDQNAEYFDRSAEIAMSITFAPKLVDLGKRVHKELLEVANKKELTTFNAIHLRVEHDWREFMKQAYNLSKNYATADLLEPYANFFKATPLSGFVYLAVGKLTKKERKLVFGWANETFGSSWTIKSRLPIYKELKLLETDALAVVDHQVIAKAHKFVGTGVSSMSYVASELRNYHGLKSWLVLPPGEVFYPMLGGRVYTWSNKTVMKLTDSRLRDD